MEEWLAANELAAHIPAFREHHITRDQLASLSDQDLRELGLTIGERKRFRAALEASGIATDTAGAGPADRASPRPAAAERRPLTVMFVDLIDSSVLGERLDPEDLGEVYRLYRALSVQAITRLGGYVARFVGDGILAYFCYPQAHENDPERAAAAALEIAAGIGGIATPAGAPLQVRVGLATGRVVVSDIAAAGVQDRTTAVGTIPNLAARLQSLAEPNGVVVCEATRARLGDRFACRPLGPTALKGFSREHHPWRVVGERPVAGRPGRQAETRRTAYQGRRAELDALRDAWRRTMLGDGGAVLVRGEAGLGKSRLVEQFLTGGPDAQGRVVALAASAFDENSPLRPVINVIWAAAGLNAADAPDTALAKIEAVLSGNAAQRRAALPVVAHLVGVRQNDPLLLQLSPEQLRERTVAVMVEQLFAVAERRPVCVVVEDLHWIDPTTEELLRVLVGRLRGRRLLLLMTTRPDFARDWLDAGGLLRLDLRRLPPEQAGAMLHDLLRDAPITRDQLDRIVARAGGVPLFLEEIARHLRDRPAGLGEGLDGMATDQIPASLDASLMARLDRSGPAKGLAQAAAVIGQSVRRDVLAFVHPTPPEALSAQLARLIEAGVLTQEQRRGAEIYSFTHALLRDAAYASLVRTRRRELHKAAAWALLALDADAVQQAPEVIAAHLTEGEQADQAAPYWLEAARRSLARSALTEASRMLRRGKAALEALPPTQERLGLRLHFAALLGPALIGLVGAAAAETQALYTESYELCWQLPEDEVHFPILWGWWRLAVDGHTGLTRSERLLDHARQRSDPELLLQAHHCCWASCLHVGDFDRCCEHVADGLAIYGRGDYRHHARLYGNHDAKVCAHGGMSQLRWMQGRLCEAVEEERQSLDWAGEIDHLGSTLHAKGLTLLHRVYRRDFPDVLERAEELVDLTSQYGFSDQAAAGELFRGWVVALREDAGTGVAVMEQALERQRGIATNEDLPVYLCLLAEGLILAGRPDQAAERIARERPDFGRSGLRVWVPELIRMQGEAVLAADPGTHDAALQLFREAADLARSQGAWMLNLRAALSEARLALRRRLPDQAAAILRAALARVADIDGSAELDVAGRMLGIAERAAVPAGSRTPDEAEWPSTAIL